MGIFSRLFARNNNKPQESSPATKAAPTGDKTSFSFRSFTANCGNDKIGYGASMGLRQQCKHENADFYVINCQEVNFEKTRKQLAEQFAGDGYEVVCVAKMPTHTKLSTQLNNNTGIATFVIHKKELTVEVKGEPEAVRREDKRFGGSRGAYNKGGLITDLVISRPGGSHIEVKTVSGHLEAKHADRRALDWANISRGISKNVDRWSQLVDATPNLTLAGYDANTRDYLVKDEDTQSHRIDKVLNTPNSLDTRAIHTAPIAGQQFSANSTYNSSDSNILTTPDKKRAGNVKGGALDYVAVGGMIGQKGYNPENEKRPQLAPDIKDYRAMKENESVLSFGEDHDSKRDHDVIGSSLQTYSSPVNSFDKVKNHMYERLRVAAPQMAKEILALSGTTNVDRATLLYVHNTFLSKDGLLNQVTELHAEKLQCLKAHEAKGRDTTAINELMSSSPPFKDASLNNLQQFVPAYEEKIKAERGKINELTVALNVNIAPAKPKPEVGQQYTDAPALPNRQSSDQYVAIPENFAANQRNQAASSNYAAMDMKPEERGFNQFGKQPAQPVASKPEVRGNHFTLPSDPKARPLPVPEPAAIVGHYKSSVPRAPQEEISAAQDRTNTPTKT